MRIFVSKPSLPPIEEFISHLEQIWESRWLTNDGPFHVRFEKELANYLGVEYISLFANGTLALITALRALEIRGGSYHNPVQFFGHHACPVVEQHQTGIFRYRRR